MNGFLAKPFTLAQLQQQLARWLPAASCAQGHTLAIPQPDEDTEPSRASETINMATLATLREIGLSAGQDLVTGLLQRFLETADKRVSEIENAIRERDGTRLSRTAHALKSSTANIGAEILSGLYRQFDVLGREGKIEEALELLARLKQDHAHAMWRVREILGKAA